MRGGCQVAFFMSVCAKKRGRMRYETPLSPVERLQRRRPHSWTLSGPYLDKCSSTFTQTLAGTLLDKHTHRGDSSLGEGWHSLTVWWGAIIDLLSPCTASPPPLMLDCDRGQDGGKRWMYKSMQWMRVGWGLGWGDSSGAWEWGDGPSMLTIGSSMTYREGQCICLLWSKHVK